MKFYISELLLSAFLMVILAVGYNLSWKTTLIGIPLIYLGVQSIFSWADRS